MTKESRLTAEVTLDLTGLTCPAPLVGAKRVVDDLAPGQMLKLISDCPGTRDDLYIWARQTGNEIAHVEHEAGKRYAFFVRKGQTPAKQAHVRLDMRGAVCPGPILEARRLLDGMKRGEVLQLLTSCSAAPDEIRTWVRATNQELLDEREVGAGEWEFILRRR